MKRRVLKTLTKTDLEFIPEEYKDFKASAKDIYQRPLIFVGRRLTRDEYFEFQDLTKAEFPEGVDSSKLSQEERIKLIKVTGKVEAYRYVWDICISKIKNVIIEVEGEVKEMDECTDKDLIWNHAAGLNTEIMEALAFFINESSFSEADSKN